MSEPTSGKIQVLLKNAALQSDSASPENSSIARASRLCKTENEAGEVFELLKSKLFRIPFWNDASEISSFELYNAAGDALTEKPAAAGDFLRINLPGSGKEDWVKIIEIYESPDEVVLTVQPSPNPTGESTKTSTSHFFTGNSTNNFCLQKKDAKVNFYVVGLNEETNTEDTSGVLETIRNFATANVGSWFGIQKIQWQTFCENFLEIEKSN